MILHSERIPAGPAVVGALHTSPRPWALDRMTPYPDSPIAAYTITLDPVRQTAVYRDEDGAVFDMPRHGTSSHTRPPTGTSPDGTPDTDTGQDGDQ